MKFVKWRTNLRANKSWVALGADTMCRAAFHSIGTSLHINYLGFFSLPREQFAWESMTPAAEVDRVLRRLSETGLIEYDFVTEYVRLVGWFLHEYIPENADVVQRRGADLLSGDYPMTAQTGRVVAELIVGCGIRGGLLKARSNHFDALIEEARGILRVAVDMFPDQAANLQAQIMACRGRAPRQFDALQLILDEVTHRPNAVTPRWVQSSHTVYPQESEKREKGYEERAEELSVSKESLTPRSTTKMSLLAQQALAEQEKKRLLRDSATGPG